MKVRFGNVWAKVLEADMLETEWLDEYTSCEYTVYTGSPNWSPDRRYHMFDRASHIFPTGFIKMLRMGAKRDGIVLELEDMRSRPCTPELDETLVPWLRDYQRDAVWESVKKGGRGLIKVPTGGGKTEIAVGLTRVLPCEWLFVVHRTDLVTQAAKRFSLRSGETAGQWSGGWIKGTSNFTVSSFQALMYAKRKNKAAYREFVKNIQGVLVDEVHAQPADSFYGVTLDLEEAFYRVGLSGTPLDRTEKENLRTVGALGPMLFEVPYELLRDRGLLSQSHVYMVEFKHGETGEGANWRSVYQSMIVRNFERNQLLADIAGLAMKPCLLFVDEEDHARQVMTQLEMNGLRCDFAYGNDWEASRMRKIKQLVEGELDVLICSVIFQEGIDIPALRSVVVGGAKSSVVATLQRMGRGMRTDADTGKYDFEVWDILDRNQRWLTDHATTRSNSYESAGHEVKVVKNLSEFAKGRPSLSVPATDQST